MTTEEKSKGLTARESVAAMSRVGSPAARAYDYYRQNPTPGRLDHLVKTLMLTTGRTKGPSAWSQKIDPAAYKRAVETDGRALEEMAKKERSTKK